MIILGLNYYYHDTTASIVQNGELVVAIEEERLTRNKHTWSFPYQSIKKVMDVSNIKPSDIDHIAVSIKPTLNVFSKIQYGLSNITKLKPFIKHELIQGLYKQRAFWKWYKKSFSHLKSKPEVHFVPHHISHAVGSFYVSPYNEAALLGIDGSGEWATSFLGHGKGLDYKEFNQSYFPLSMGSFYEAITEYCGFQPNYDEGKTMGLAPLGDPDVFYDEMSKLIDIGDNGEINIDLSYFKYQHLGAKRYSQKFIEKFGPPRNSDDFSDHHLNVAAAAQKVLEDRVLDLCEVLYNKTKAEYIVMSGGVALNSVANGRVVRESPFKDVYVMPAAGDNGTGIGASYFVYNKILGNKRKYIHNSPYIGNEYSNDDIYKTLKECKLNALYFDDICDEAARLLHEGNIIGWFQGKMEIGPRSLGNRSILADPSMPGMKDKINSEVKHREAYRPFAPSCIDEAKNKYFETEVEDPFMLKVCHVRDEYCKTLSAITHVDGTARLQTVRKDINPRYHELLEKFGTLSGIPVLLNTSFNVMGEPIVESPMHAIKCFFTTGLDVLIIGNYKITK